MLSTVLHTHIKFFDANPVGRLLNRFSKDIGVADQVIAPVTDYFVLSYARVLTILGLTCVLIPYLLPAVFVLFCIVLLVRLRAMKVTNEVMKLELLTRSPISTQLGSSVTGLPTIRAYQRSEHFFA